MGAKKALQTGWVSNHLFEPSVGNQIFENMVKSETLLKPYFGVKIIAIEKKKRVGKLISVVPIKLSPSLQRF